MGAKATPDSKAIRTIGLYMKSVLTLGTMDSDYFQRRVQVMDDIRLIGVTAQLDIWQEDYDSVSTGYQSSHLWVGTAPMTYDDVVQLAIPAGIIDECQVLATVRDGGALADQAQGVLVANIRLIFPEGMGIDLDKNDYLYGSLAHLVVGFTGAGKELYSLCRVKFLYVER